MMISIGYYFDQVSRERMVQRISEQVNLIASAAPNDAPVPRNGVVWIETAHPNYHQLDVTWDVDGGPLSAARGVTSVDLETLAPAETARTITVTVVDPTPFVRDPAIRAKVLTATRSWTLGPPSVETGAAVSARLTGGTPVDRPVGAAEVVYVTTTHPSDRVTDVSWRLNGQPVTTAPGTRTLPLASRQLPAGTHELTATVEASAAAATPDAVRRWTVDNIMPTVTYTLSTPIETTTEADGTPHYVFDSEFTMELQPADDQPGYVVAEFRVNGDGWHHYYGWPDAPPGTPYKFTLRGTTIKELVYGSLSSEGLSPQPWEPRTPGRGTHRIEYRAIDAAGNIGPASAFLVTVR